MENVTLDKCKYCGEELVLAKGIGNYCPNLNCTDREYQSLNVKEPISYSDDTKTIKAKVYKLKIHDSAMDMVHGGGRFICEIYIPEFKIAYNKEAAFILDSKKRYKGKQAKLIKTIEIPSAILFKLQNYIEAREGLKEVDGWLGEQKFKIDFDKMATRGQKKHYVKAKKSYLTAIEKLKVLKSRGDNE